MYDTELDWRKSWLIDKVISHDISISTQERSHIVEQTSGTSEVNSPVMLS